MLPCFKKVITGIACLFTIINAKAQTSAHVVTGTITEKVIAEIRVSQFIGNKFSSIAEFTISPDNRDFAFAIPEDQGATYRLQISLFKPGGRHPKLDKIGVLPLPLKAGRNYALKITPSRLDTVKKTGWELRQDRAKPSVALISGKVNGNFAKGLRLTLHHVADGSLLSGNSFLTNPEGEFVVPCQVKQAGFYYLSSLRWKTRVYLKPADKLELNVDNKSGDVTSVQGSRENQILNKWQQLIAPITSYGYNLSMFTADSINLDSYFSAYEKLQPVMADFSKNLDGMDASFNRAFKNVMELDRELAPLNLLFQLSARKINGFRATPKDFNEVPAFYRQFIQPGKFGNTTILLLGEARQYMNLYAKLNVALLPKEQRAILSQSEKLKLMIDAISNDTLKSLFFNDQMWQMEVNNLSEFKTNLEPFKKYAKLKPAKDAYQSIYSMYSGDTAYIGKSSYNFSLPDTSGRMVSMKDFKGKVVFIDVWATWCGPCKAQFPFLKEIEEEYKDNPDLIFLSISIDRVSDRGKWLKMIRKENLQGVQLLDDMGKAFARPYEINAIPRFLLIDKQGKWIEIRCPQPESKENLKKYLDKALMEIV